MRTQLEHTFGPAQPPTEREVVAAVKEIMGEEAGAPPLAPTGAAAPTTLGDGGSGTAEAAKGGGPSLAEEAPAATAPLGPVSRRTGRAGMRAAAAALAALD